MASSHGTPWSYDSYVPVIFAGASLKAKKVYEKIETVDIARTLSAYMHIKAPSGANGSILKEVFDK